MRAARYVRLVAELRGDLLHPKWPEDLCWVGGGVGLAACYPENADERRQASLIYFNAHVEVRSTRGERSGGRVREV